MPRYNKIFAGPVTEVTPQVEECLANVALTPGQIVTRNGSGKFILHATAGGRGRFRVVQDNYLAQEGVDTAIAADDTAIGLIPLDEQFYYVRVVTGQNLTKGDPLVSNGAGALTKGVTSGHHVLFWAEETYNNASGSTQLVLARPGQGVMP
jgi:hypothetical protein